MPLGEIAGEAIGGIIRLIGEVLLEVVFEFLVCGPGYLICRMFGYKGPSDGWLPGIVGLIFWSALLTGVYMLFVAGPT